MSANIAVYLEPLGRERYSVFNRVKGSYNRRSKAAHGSGEPDLTPCAETYALAKRALLKMIEARQLPDQKELELVCLATQSASQLAQLLNNNAPFP